MDTRQALCMMCHSKGNHAKLQKLQRLNQICDNSSAPEADIRKSPIRTFQWELHSRCRYGIPCNELESFDNNCKRIARKIEKRLIQIAMDEDNASEYHQILEMLRGDFPAVYTAMERIRHAR